MAAAPIIPVILSGGSGTRLWPMSRRAHPKQFLSLGGEASMFAQTLERVGERARFDASIIVGGPQHRALMAQALMDAGIASATLILEPQPRNTAPAIALAALTAGGDRVLLVMPSDHRIADPAAFLAAVTSALPAAQAGWLVTFGIAPTAAETGYGYIRMGEAVADQPDAGVRRAEAFIEKPPVEAAHLMLAEGNHVWNAGIFLFRADRYLEELERHAPAMLDAARAAMDKAERQGACVLPDAKSFAASPADSIDYAVMERSDRVAVVPVACGWSDLGSWDAIYDIGAADADGNVAPPDALLIDSANCLVQSDGVKVTAVGVHDLIVIATRDHVMVLPRGRSQDVKRIVERLDEGER